MMMPHPTDSIFVIALSENHTIGFPSPINACCVTFIEPLLLPMVSAFLVSRMFDTSCLLQNNDMVD
jgi:hypothetical protein